MNTYYIKVRNQAGTTLYHIGDFKSIGEAHEKAIKGYGWYRVESEKYEIVTD